MTVAGTRLVATKLLAGDTQPAFRIMGDGRLEWGPGASTAPDTSLFRLAAAYLQTNATLAVAGLTSGLIISTRQLPANALQLYATNDTQPRMNLINSARIEFGPGNAPIDTNLYRSAANILETDDKFVPASLNIQTKAGAPVDADIVGGAADGDVMVDTTNSRLFFRAGGTWKAPAERDQAVIAAAGMLSWSFDPAIARSGLTLAGGTARSRMLGLVAGETVTGLVVMLWTAAVGTAPTSFKLGLYQAGSPNATLVAQTGELAADAAWTTTGYKSFPLTSPYVVPTTGGYYVAALMVGAFGTTQPQVALGIGSSVVLVPIAGALPLALAPSGLSALPATISTGFRDGQFLWVGATGTAA